MRNSITLKMIHPNIIKCHDFFEDENDVYIILEYAEKGDLFEFVKKEKLD
jgi:serine/threonine-protein kinase HSL1 (negative regulator of Swe1 kinase)